ncbi:MAG: extracellular solute-binding protein [Xenococcus sp. (in: cyanobacteria)]
MSKYWLRKIGLILLTLSIAVACSRQEKYQTKNQVEELKGAIMLWAEVPPVSTGNVQGSNKSALEDRIEEFKELYPEVQVLVEYFLPGQSLKQFELQAKRGSGPDLLLANASYEIVSLIRNKELRAIDEFEIDYSGFSDETIKQIRYQDKTYGLPVYLSTQLLCYNKDKVKKTPKTLQELIDQARQGYSVGLVSSLAETFWGAGIFGGKLFDDSGHFALTEGRGWVSWMEWLIEAQNEPNFILSKNKEALQNSFIEGQLAYLTCSSRLIPYLIGSMGKNKLGVALLPVEANRAATPLLEVGVLYFNRDSTIKQTQLAIKLAKFLSSREQQEQAQAAFLFIPSNQDATLNRQLFPRRAIMLEQSKSAVSIALDDIEELRVMRKEGNIIYQKILQGEMTPEQAANKLTQTINRKSEVQR